MVGSNQYHVIGHTNGRLKVTIVTKYYIIHNHCLLCKQILLFIYSYKQSVTKYTVISMQRIEE